jgi:hypothetical protein
VDGNNADAGDITLIMGNTQSGTDMLASQREYVEHRGGKAISGGTVSWDFNWTSPGTAAGNSIRFYFIANFSNNNNGSGGDYIVPNALFLDFNGPPPVEAGISASTNVSCNGGNNGSATVSASGGIPPYTYLWSNGQTGETAANLIAGNYIVTVTGASGSGTTTASVIISQPATLNILPTVSGSIDCENSEVIVTANVTGGTGAYDYAWSNGGTGNSSLYTAPGVYSLTVTDANDCTKSATFSINSNLNSPTAAAFANEAISCSNSSVTLSGTGSSTGASFTYLWSTIDGSIVSGQNSLNPTVNECGTYTLTVTNATNGCTAQASVEVFCNITTPNANAIGGSLTCSSTSAVLNGNSVVGHKC